MNRPAVAAESENQAYGRGVAFAVSGKEPVAIASDGGACLVAATRLFSIA